jgi:hypothetical protein
MNILRFPERTSGITQGDVDVVTFLDQLIEILGFPGERLLQKPEEVFGRWSLIVVPKLDMVAPPGGCIFHYQTEIPVLKPLFIHYLAVHILLPEYVQNRHCA